MTDNEMNLLIAELAVKCQVTHEEARAALEAGNWNRLTAAQMLEVEKRRKAQELDQVASSCATVTAPAPAEEITEEGEFGTTEKFESAEATAAAAKTEETGKRRGSRGLKNLGDHIRRIVAFGNRNRFVVRRNGVGLLELPVSVVAVLMLFAFWTCVPLLAIGLFLGCRYSFSGQDLGRESVNLALDRAANAAQRLRKNAAVS